MNKAIFFAGFILGIIVSLTAYIIMGVLSGEIKGLEDPLLNNTQFQNEEALSDDTK